MLAARAVVAGTFVSRLVGLLKTPELKKDDGLFIVPCSQIHMFGMKYAIDAVFLDRDMHVVGLCSSIQPGQISKLYSKAHACLELPAGTILDTATQEGDEIESGSAS